MVRFRGIYPCYDDSIILIKAVNPILPAIKRTTIKIPQRSGVFNIDKTHDERIITLTYELNGKSAARNAELAAALARWAEGEKCGQMVFDEATDRFYLALLDNATEPDYAEAFPTVTLTFSCANPYAFANAISYANIGDTIVYLGDITVSPMITFTPDEDVSDPSWTMGDRTLNLVGYTLQAGHTLIIDNANGNVTDNGNSVMEYMPITSDWLRIWRGGVDFSGAGGVASWRNIYL